MFPFFRQIRPLPRRLKFPALVSVPTAVNLPENKHFSLCIIHGEVSSCVWIAEKASSRALERTLMVGETVVPFGFDPNKQIKAAEKLCIVCSIMVHLHLNRLQCTPACRTQNSRAKALSCFGPCATEGHRQKCHSHRREPGSPLRCSPCICPARRKFGRTSC